MRLHRLTLTAFGPFAGSHTVDFDELSSAGLFLLHGATGAGKTSVLDGVCYALYGGVPGSRPGNRLRSDHAGPDTPTEVVLDLTVGGRRLEVTRRPEQPRPKKRGSGFTMEKAVTLLREQSAGQWRALSKSHQEAGEELLRLIGMSREQFCQVVLLPQGEFATFLRATATDRAALLGKLFDTRRFKAAEEWLKAQRNAAQSRVREGDDELLRLAHGMQQAAGDGSERLEDWLPEGAGAGHPDFAPHVLQWAAVLRATAHEQAAVSDLATTAAETAHAAAQRAAEDVRELHTLQRRHAAAMRRAAALEEQSEVRDSEEAVLETARRAETVGPALELRDRAAVRHRRAAEQERAARADLPAELTGAGADQLTAYGNGLREELGGLTEAGRAEHRAAELVAERARLERETGADEQLIADAGAWLEDWERVRLGHERRIDTAQAAATRAAELAGTLDSSRRRLSAARERDAHERELGAAEERLRAAREAAADAREHWQDVREARINGIAAELAARLRDGEGCLVCGATEHPHPARPSDRQVGRAEEEAAQTAHQEAADARESAQAEVARVTAARDAAATEAGRTPEAELAAAHAELERACREASAEAAALPEARQALDRAVAEHTRRTRLRHEAESRVASVTSRREVLDQEHSALTGQLARARGAFATVAERRDRLAEQAERIAAAPAAARAEQDTARALKDADADLADAAYRAGFDTPEAAAAALLPSAEVQRLRQRAEERRREEAAVTAELTALDVAEAAGLPPADPEGARRAVEDATHRLRGATARQDAARSTCAALDRLGAAALTRTRELAPARAEYARLRRLADLATGAGENTLRMELETYVLAARLEQVAAAASVRLQRMSSGRYTLVHTDARASRGVKSGLGLMAVDAWTGTERDTATLSGGETFFASLALALGLADVVTDEAGGARLDTLFIDEGFGSLDEQTLDEVLDVLDGLRERDRAVGIVSHVADLRQRIPAQLQVVKGQGGSSLRHRAAGER
ncbi:SMC family ATPase [Streptomyces sp. MI02-7b]|uniref:SMC family ATPase n=1 Tax=Streptomyces sp. MI02-7b TaxID=462941 RepID=UPI0029A330FF|nr:SMC family ATPase [Streptomyces sp. MI02-7b]MDX3073944.1 SMC family ATPase [Streptomyces sp. MI02-7b]